MILIGSCVSFNYAYAKPVAGEHREAALTNSPDEQDTSATGCSPVSTMACADIKQVLPFAVSFSGPVAGTIADKNGQGTGFTTVNTYSGTRNAADGQPSNPQVPGYEPSKITLAGGRLQLVANKGIDYQTNNNQINVLGVKIKTVRRLQLETKLINPVNGSSSQQGGLWYGLDDKTYIKLGVTGNKVELRKEQNDVTSTISGTSNPDQRITSTITGLNTKTVQLRMVVDSDANTVEGFYSIDGGNTFVSTGTAYSNSKMSISGMGVVDGEAYAGIFGTYRNGTSPVTYTFDDFAVNDTSPSAPPVVVIQTINIDFQPQGTAVPSGYIADNGLAFSTTRKFGWISSITREPASYSANMRLRSGTGDAKQLSVVQMQSANADNTVPGVWEYAVDNGRYTVTVGTGDNSYYDSDHQINVEGLPAVTDFRPSSSNKFRVGTATVQVSDGKLTIDATGGVNSKLTYLSFTPEVSVTDETAPVLSARYTGTIQSGTVYTGPVKIFVTATDAGGSGLATLQYAVNGGAYTNYTAPFTVSTPGSYTLTMKATDANGNSKTTSASSFSIYAAPTTSPYMVVKNQDGFPADDRMVFSYIQKPWRRTSPDTTAYNANHDKAKLRISNKGTGVLNVSSLTLSNTANWKVIAINSDSSASLPVSIASKSYVDIAIQFTAKDAATRIKIFKDSLTIRSNDVEFPVKKVLLRGLYQAAGEGNHEAYASELITLFGFDSKTGYTHDDGTIEGKTIVPNSSEINASFFVRADPSKPVTVYQLAAYHGCCGSIETFKYYPKGSASSAVSLFTHNPLDGQSVLPRLRNSATALAKGSFNPTGAFGFNVGSSWSDTTRNLEGKIGIRCLKVLDSDGLIVPNAYLLNGDYLGTPFTNFDYQDNIYYVDNIRPETGTAYYPNLISVNSSDVNFDPTQTGSSKTVSVTLKNNGTTYSNGTSDQSVKITSVQISGPNASEFSVSALATTTLALQATTSLNVKFTPGSVGIKNAVLLVNYNTSISPLRIPLYAVANSSSATVNAVLRIKGGSDSDMTIGGNVFKADDIYRKGSIKLDAQVVAGDVSATDLETLYRTYLSAATDLAETRYEIPLTNGDYKIRMHFVENYQTSTGLRVFTTSIENQLVLPNFDIFKEVGYREALVKDFSATVSDGVLNIRFVPTANRVAIAGLEIFKITNNNLRIAAEDSVVAEITPKKLLVAEEIKTEILPRGIAVYPNPSTGDQVNLNASNFGKNETVTVSIVSMSGITVQTQTIVTDQAGNAVSTVTTGNKLSRGIYIINAKSASGVVRSKLLVE